MYVTVKDILDEGISCTEARITSAILLAGNYIDRMTGRWFDKRTKTLKLSGTATKLYDDGMTEKIRGRKIFYLPHFPFTLTEVKVDDVALTAGFEEDYILSNNFFPDQRNMPEIEFAVAPAKGHNNIELTGSWGYVEEDGTVPLLIQKICKKLALVEINRLSELDRRDVIDRGRIIKETTDGHSYEMGKLIGQGGYTGDPEIDTVLISYRRPPEMAAV